MNKILSTDNSTVRNVLRCLDNCEIIDPDDSHSYHMIGYLLPFESLQLLPFESLQLLPCESLQPLPCESSTVSANFYSRGKIKRRG